MLGEFHSAVCAFVIWIICNWDQYLLITSIVWPSSLIIKRFFVPTGKLESTRVDAYECLAELSKIMRVLLEKYSLSKSKELLIDSRSLIAAVKSYEYESYSSECHINVIDAINKMYNSFQARYAFTIPESIFFDHWSPCAVVVACWHTEKSQSLHDVTLASLFTRSPCFWMRLMATTN